MKPERVVIPGIPKSPPEGATVIGTVNPDEKIEVTLIVRRRRPLPAAPVNEPFISREKFAELYGADPADFEILRRFATEHRFEVVFEDLGQRVFRISGPASALKAAFDVSLNVYSHRNHRFFSCTGPVSMPASVARVVEGVFGLDTRAQAKPHFRLKPSPGKIQMNAAGAGPLTPLQVARLYNFPVNLDGAGQCIAIIELGGGYQTADLIQYFTKLGLSPPQVIEISVLGGKNDPTGPTKDANGEVMLDIEVAGAIAPKAAIAVYFAPNTDDGFRQAISDAVHDTQRKPSVVSISWGGPESSWTPQAMQAFDAVCQDAAMLGVTIFCASGDNGASDLVQPDGRVHADFPASSPNVIACGGTHLEGSGNSITSETVWNNTTDGGATGGGVSEFFALPNYQINMGIPPSVNPDHKSGRGLPDVAGDADTDRIFKSPPLSNREKRFQRHHSRGQWRLSSGTRLGRLHRLGQPQRNSTAPGSSICVLGGCFEMVRAKAPSRKAEK